MLKTRAGGEPGLVAPSRFGAALTAAREASGQTIEDIAAAAVGRFTVATLREIERGGERVDDASLSALADLYELKARPLDGGATELVLDRSSTVHTERRPISRRRTDADTVLVRYLALRTLLDRRSSAETSMDLPDDDVRVLAAALQAEDGEIEFRLQRLVETDTARISVLATELARRPALARIGVLVAELPTGTLVLVQRKAAAAPKMAAAAGLVAASAAVAPLADLLSGGGASASEGTDTDAPHWSAAAADPEADDFDGVFSDDDVVEGVAQAVTAEADFGTGDGGAEVIEADFAVLHEVAEAEVLEPEAEVEIGEAAVLYPVNPIFPVYDEVEAAAEAASLSGDPGLDGSAELGGFDGLGSDPTVSGIGDAAGEDIAFG